MINNLDFFRCWFFRLERVCGRLPGDLQSTVSFPVSMLGLSLRTNLLGGIIYNNVVRRQPSVGELGRHNPCGP